jgi:hypothetical protein
MEVQTSFLDIAVPIAEQGVPVIRLRPKSKIPIEKHWPDLATTDTSVLKTWDEQTPDAGCASVAKADGFLFFESDEPGTIKKFQEETGESFQTFTVQSRPGRFHFYFSQTDLTRKIGSITQKELKFGSLRQNNAYVVSPGSIHPDTGEAYKVVRNAPIIPMPDVFLNWLVARKTKSEAADAVEREAGKLVPHGQIHNAMVVQARRLLAADFHGEKLEQELVTWAHENCEAPIDDPKVRTCAKNVESNYGQQAAKQKNEYVTIGGVVPGAPPPSASASSSPKEQEERDAIVAAISAERESEEDHDYDSPYPEWVWAGTLYSEFARLCGTGNFIPHEYFIESLKTGVGAVCGHRFLGQEARFYTFLLSKDGGTGKSSAIVWTEILLRQLGLLYDLNQEGSGAFLNIGCAKGKFASASGMANNGFSKHPRIFQIFDEGTSLLEKFGIQGSGDSYLNAVNEMYERGFYTPELAKTSKILNNSPGSCHHSILAGTVFDNWNSAFGKTSAEGSGFFQRLNIISSEETRTVAELNDPDFTDFSVSLFKKIKPLEYQTIAVLKDPDADRLFNSWHTKFQNEHRDDPKDVVGRLSVQVIRNYQHLAWLLAPEVKEDPANANTPIQVMCSLETMEKAIALAEYQFGMRSKHRPAVGKNDWALLEDIIKKTLIASPNKAMIRNKLWKQAGVRKFGISVFDRALNNMNSEGHVELFTPEKFSGKGRKGQVVVWKGD